MKKQPKLTKFLICPDEQENELYILHREFPACLIWVKQVTPVRFVVLDLYDEIENPNDILQMDFVQKAKDFYNNIASNSFDKN
jgi:hypothetical protein